MLRRAVVRASADAGLKPASSAEASLRAVTGCEYDLCQAFRQDQDESPGERRLCRRTVLRTMYGERSRCLQLTSVQVRLRRSEEKCARCRALSAPAVCALRWPFGRMEDVPCGTDVMTPTYSCAIRTSTPSERSSDAPPSRKSQTRAARRRCQCPKARPSAGSKRSEEHWRRRARREHQRRDGAGREFLRAECDVLAGNMAMRADPISERITDCFFPANLDTIMCTRAARSSGTC